jgi:sirohydrochlorin ferrochelatase
MKAILIVDHGSVRAEANNMLECVANLVQAMAGGDVLVRFAHMELAEPLIPEGFAACVNAGATEVVVFPYMLSPGKHSTRDIPRMVAETAAAYPGVAYRVTNAFGVHEKLGELILLRAGVAPAAGYATAAMACCWDPARSTTACGEACRARQDAAGPAGDQTVGNLSVPTPTLGAAARQ